MVLADDRSLFPCHGDSAPGSGHDASHYLPGRYGVDSMPLILNQKRYSSKYDDDPGVRYHYPEQYASYIQTGEIFIYYHPSEKPLDPHIYYFGMGRIGTVRSDPAHSDHYYAEILDYVPFGAREIPKSWLDALLRREDLLDLH